MKLPLLLFLFLSSLAFSQSTHTLSGQVVNAEGAPVFYAHVSLEEGQQYAVADQEGQFQIEALPPGEYVVKASAVGYAVWSESVVLDQNRTLTITLTPSVQELNNIVVLGKTEAREVSEQPIAINSLDTKPVMDQALGAEQLLKVSTGVVVRQTGGLGSNVNINLNGLSGQAVRIYFDGIPINVFGGGLQLNTIPVDALERIDVYKGVMPIAVGTDALGGGINLVPARKSQDYLQTSYTIGSFNTHRFTLNAHKNLSGKLAISTLAYFNYSDNDYEMRDIRSITENTLANGSVVAGSEETIDVRRFHDRHVSGYAEASIQLRDLAWADRLDLTTSYARRDDEIQHGAFITNTAVGEAEFDINTLAQRLDYRKALLNDRLDVRYYGVLSVAQSQVRDSSRFRYNWRGERLTTTNASGSELFPIPTLREGRDLGTAHRLVLNYTLSEHFALTVSEFFRYTEIEGNDPVGSRISIGDTSLDPNTVPSRLGRNIVGAEFTATLLKEKLTTVAFYKNYDYNAESIDILQRSATRLPLREVQANENGYGLAVKYQLHPTMFVRSSFERAVRIPTEVEIFGDFGAILPNYELRPEKSNNYNLGVQYSTFLSTHQELFLRLDGFVRSQEDLIRPDAFGPENTRFINEAQVAGRGAEFSVRYSPIKNLRLSGNFTYQSNEIGAGGNAAPGQLIGNQVPNIPQLFYNAGVRYTFEDVFKELNTLEVFWDYLFIDRFSINEVADLDRANPLFIIPAQRVHNAGVIYRLQEEGLRCSLNVQNVFNAEVFDNFRIPRPGINYQFKVSYSLQPNR
ncbi:TonB-dependent receptor [Tunicatimonas pelagia]|uniref:TonB-dependent receptor n=1 Tax=Tunicatimonas pelagia TaxID=931531 RepID=UPI002665B859|nr:TonB-dependent receptor [Tunicatimonas pelagia]WKN42998.1 TonB-dependent receptor [Tunicatimonas pelagia]